MPIMFFDWTMILLIPALILTIYAQAKVSSTYKKYSHVRRVQELLLAIWRVKCSIIMG